MLSTRIRIWLVWNQEHIKLTSNFPTQRKISHACKYIYWPRNTAGQHCIPLLQDNTIPDVSHCWTETVFTVQNKKPSAVRILCPSSRTSTEGFTHKKSHRWTHFYCSRKPKCVLKPCYNKVSNKLITTLDEFLRFMTSWSTRNLQRGANV